MNIQKLISFSSNILLATTATSVVVMSLSPIAKADLFCYPWESGCKVDGSPGTSGNGMGGNARDGFIIYVRNNTGQTIFVSVDGYVSSPGNESCSKINQNQNIPNKNQSLFAYTGQKLFVNSSQSLSNKGSILLASCAYSGWRTFGTYTFSPGERALLLNGSNRVTGRNATFKAYSQNGNKWEKTVDMGSHIGEFEFTFR